MLTAELEKTKADNVKLYGKIRYVQDYNLEKVVSRGSKKVQYPQLIHLYVVSYHACSMFFLAQNSLFLQHSEDLESGFSSDVESKYKKIYEDDINPFAAFSKKVCDLLFLRSFYKLVIWL